MNAPAFPMTGGGVGGVPLLDNSITPPSVNNPVAPSPSPQPTHISSTSSYTPPASTTPTPPANVTPYVSVGPAIVPQTAPDAPPATPQMIDTLSQLPGFVLGGA